MANLFGGGGGGTPAAATPPPDIKPVIAVEEVKPAVADVKPEVKVEQPTADDAAGLWEGEVMRMGVGMGNADVALYAFPLPLRCPFSSD